MVKRHKIFHSNWETLLNVSRLLSNNKTAKHQTTITVILLIIRSQLICLRRLVTHQLASPVRLIVRSVIVRDRSTDRRPNYASIIFAQKFAHSSANISNDCTEDPNKHGPPLISRVVATSCQRIFWITQWWHNCRWAPNSHGKTCRSCSTLATYFQRRRNQSWVMDFRSLAAVFLMISSTRCSSPNCTWFKKSNSQMKTEKSLTKNVSYARIKVNTPRLLKNESTN